MGNARREEADGGVHFVLGHAGPQLVSMSPGPPQRKPRRKIPAEKTRSAQRWEPHPQTAQPDTQRGPWAEGSAADVEESWNTAADVEESWNTIADVKRAGTLSLTWERAGTPSLTWKRAGTPSLTSFGGSLLTERPALPPTKQSTAPASRTSTLP